MHLQGSDMSKDFKIEIRFNRFPQMAEKVHDAVSDIVRKTALDVEGQANSRHSAWNRIMI